MPLINTPRQAAEEALREMVLFSLEGDLNQGDVIDARVVLNQMSPGPLREFFEAILEMTVQGEVWVASNDELLELGERAALHSQAQES